MIGAFDRPTSDEIRAALDRILDSRAFRASPQLSAFLRFVVEAELAGTPDRIKGYTIAVEALGRSADFDPQADPIVRVEAARLRRVLERYYAEAGPTEPVLIDLPRGSYVPTFRTGVTPQTSRLPDFPRLRMRMRLGSRVLRRRLDLIGVLGVVVLAVGGYALLDAFVLDPMLRNPQTTSAITAQPTPRRFAGPTVYIEPIRVIGSTPASATPAALQERLYDAFARFDGVQVVTDANTEARVIALTSNYRLAGAIEPRDDGGATLLMRLVDARDHVVFWSRSFDMPQQLGDRTAIDAIVKTIAGTAMYPYGAVQARELAKYAASPNDTFYPCLQRAYEYLWTSNPAMGPEARACLEQAVAADPTFARGYHLLGAIYMILYRLGEEPGPEMIERALTAARTAVRLNASSARANIVLADALLSRGLFADAQETAERALALNPLDPVVSFYYAAVLVLAGDIDKGDAALRDVFASLSDPPQRAYFIAFVADYVRGNLQAAAQHAGRLTLSPYTPALLARTLAAWKAGDQERARQAIALLTATQRGWTTDPRGEIGRLFPLPEMAERFAADFDAASRFAFP